MNNTKSIRIRALDPAYIALGAVLITVCSWISIPTVVPFTMQTFAVFCVISLLGGKRGTASVILYLIIGAAGVPVFSRFTAGAGALLGATGGYLTGFVLIGLIYWLAVRIFGKRIWVEAAAMVVGLAVLYFFGTLWVIAVYTRSTGSISVMTALSWCVFPFIIPDLLKMALALFVSHRVKLPEQSM